MRQIVTWPVRMRAMSRNMNDSLMLWQSRYHELDEEMHERKRVEEALLDISSREQERIRQDLHDTVVQELTGLNFQVRNLMDALAGEGEEYRVLGEDLFETTTRVGNEVRRAIRGLTPVDPYPDGLSLGLKDLVDQSRDRVKGRVEYVEHKKVLMQDQQCARHLYRIGQEALNNALKYAKADLIRVSLSNEDGCVILEVKDDGIGFREGEIQGGGMGQSIMKYRANVMGAELSVESASGKGTRVLCVIPTSEELGEDFKGGVSKNG